MDASVTYQMCRAILSPVSSQMGTSIPSEENTLFAIPTPAFCPTGWLISTSILRTVTIRPSSALSPGSSTRKLSTLYLASFGRITILAVSPRLDGVTGSETSKLLIPSLPFHIYSLPRLGSLAPSGDSRSTTRATSAARKASPRSVVTVIFALSAGVARRRGDLRKRM